MEFHFTKMHGAGNDFVVILCPDETSPEAAFRDQPAPARIARVCDRRTGIGADGLFFLTPLVPGRFKMDFYNNDGSRASMCGNGLRCAGLCAGRYAHWADLIFETDSGVLTANVLADDGVSGRVRITIIQNDAFRSCGELNGYPVYYGVAGVPHAIAIVPDVDAVDVPHEGRALRYHEAFAPGGANVDFVEAEPRADGLHRIRTYERGVEGETPACGTGISSSGIVLHQFCK
ncbi:MAG: diaminopimelate epimerase, partial [Lentisphaeria bacterium]|nr:diaminopimelate epimerase [Lentisphaeria bacterium]